MEIFLEIMCEIYLEFALILVPEHKFKKWQEILLKILSVSVTLGVLICFIAGISILIDANKTLYTTGIILTIVGGFLTFIQIILFIIVLKKQLKKEKSKKENVE